MRPIGFAALLVLATVAPACAQSPDAIDLIARVTAGLSDGGQIGMGTLGAGAVSRSDGVYSVGFGTGIATLTFAQPQNCVFTQIAQMKGQPTTSVRFDLNQVTAISYTDQGPYNGLNAVLLQFTGGDGMVDVLAADGSASPVPAAASILTSLSLADLNAAATALRQLCPGAK